MGLKHRNKPGVISGSPCANQSLVRVSRSQSSFQNTPGVSIGEWESLWELKLGEGFTITIVVPKNT